MTMRSMVVTFGVTAALGIVGAPALAGPVCSYNWRAYSEGSTSCQSGQQFRCVNGSWQNVGTQCADDDPGDSGSRVQPGVNEPRVKDPSVKQPAAPGMNQVTQPTVP